MEDKLKESVEALVASIFSEKEEINMRTKTEDALKKSAATIDDLTVSLEGKNSEVSELTSNTSTLNDEITGLKSELEAAKKETEDASKKAEDVESLLNDMKKDQAAAKRFVVLKEAGVARVDEKEQVLRIKEMSDDDFVSYKDELIAVRSAILEELKATKVEGSTDGNTDDTLDNKDEKSSEGLDTVPAQINDDTAVTAALNLEVASTDDITEKMAELGKAMASAMK